MLLSAPLTFHIIYTPGTVSTLLPLVRSLLSWSGCRFRLVANGCRPQEVQLLSRACQRESRLELEVISEGPMLEHSEVLNRLVLKSRERYFCFLDSDILATGDFLAELQPHAEGAAALFAAWPLLTTAADQILADSTDYMAGHHRFSESGKCLGGSYFAIYDRDVLDGVLAEFPGAFDRGLRGFLPEPTQLFLEGQGEHRSFYDTGRVLNLILASRACVRSPEIRSLCHLGSFSFSRAVFPNGPQRALWLRQWWRQTRQRLDRLRASLRNPFTGEKRRLQIHKQVWQDVCQTPWYFRSRLLCPYFSQLLEALNSGDIPPEPPLCDSPEVNQRVRDLADFLHTEWPFLRLDSWLADTTVASPRRVGSARPRWQQGVSWPGNLVQPGGQFSSALVEPDRSGHPL